MANWREHFGRIKRIEALSRILSILDVWKISLSILFFIAIPWLCGGVATRASWWCHNWWFLKWCVLAIGLWLIWKKKVPECSAGQDDFGEQSQMNSDAPIKHQEQDVLSRGPLVAMLQELIRGFPENDGVRYIGLYAPWGDGKTSVINLLKERINACDDRTNIAFVEFEPWKYQSQENLPLVFFKRLSEQMMSRDREIGRRFSELARIIQLRYMGRHLGGIETVFNAINSLFGEQVWSESVIREKLTALLVKNKQKIVVVIDDLDRLPKDDVCRVIRFLKTHGELPNVIYLIAADETYLSNAIGEALVPGNEDVTSRGRKYLEKIIPLSRQLPAISAERLLEDLKKWVDELLSKQFPEGVDVANLDLSVALPYLDNIRSLKRLENALRVDLAFAKKRVGDSTYLGVDIGDFVALSIMREFERDFYDQLPNARLKMQQAMGWPYEEHCMNEKWMERHFWGLSKTEDGVENIKNFVLTRLGIDVKGKHGQPNLYALRYKDDSDELLHYRLSSRLCFPGYFISEVEDVQLYQKPISEFLASIMKREYPDELLRLLNDEGKFPFLLYMLESLKVFEDEVVSDFFMRTLTRIGEMSLKPVSLEMDVGEISWHGQDVYERVFRCLLRYCQKLKMELMAQYSHGGRPKSLVHVGVVLCPILDEEQSVTMLERFIVCSWKEHQNGAAVSFDSFFTSEEFKKMKDLYVQRIAEKQQGVGINNHPAFFNLFHTWMILLCESDRPEWNQAFAVANDRWIDSYSSLSKILIFFTNDERAERDAIYSVAADLDRLNKFFREDQLCRIENTLEGALNKDIKDELFLEAYRFAKNQKRIGASYDKEAQLAYMKSWYEKSGEKLDLKCRA